MIRGNLILLFNSKTRTELNAVQTCVVHCLLFDILNSTIRMGKRSDDLAVHH